MSGKTKWAKLAALRRREDCYFIGDKSKKRYHSKYCPLIDQIVKNDLVACGYNPEFLGFSSCPHCSPSPLPSPPKDPRRLPIGELLVEKAVKYGMNAKLSGPNIYITTVADEWFFNFTSIPIKLHHKMLKCVRTGTGVLSSTTTMFNPIPSPPPWRHLHISTGTPRPQPIGHWTQLPSNWSCCAQQTGSPNSSMMVYLFTPAAMWRRSSRVDGILLPLA